MVNGQLGIGSTFLSRNFKVINDFYIKAPPPGNYRLLSEFGDTDYPPLAPVTRAKHVRISTQGDDRTVIT